MGFYVRKSIKAGPFRFNLSKSGLGVSAGVRGFRLSTGPRGNYVHMGRHGVYYRASLNGGKSSSRETRPAAVPPSSLPRFDPHDVVMEDVTGATAMALEPTRRGDMVDQLNSAASRFAWWIPTAVVGGLLGLITIPFGLIIWLVVIPLCTWLYLNDQARRTVVVFYEVHDTAHGWFDTLVTQWAWLTESQKLWRVTQAGDIIGVQQFKRNAGASTLISSVSAAADFSGPKQLKTNIEIPSISAGQSALHFLPDRLLVRDGKRFSDVGYSDLRVAYQPTRFIESSTPPSDASRWTLHGDT
ncbi:hypothetical protein C1Y40_04028 [Mycobacterium talmoniae]|uniref:DUF4236 domain-containing protein n=1 Tax=Mycobacterium talmoniae TaxID=1858794 RepID=A0A2S8BGM1_9MYCO|nr:hypothetical protein C1Y40_04028 [Mycobacterium talmoniae]